jgi:hypothetical protein
MYLKKSASAFAPSLAIIVLSVFVLSGCALPPPAASGAIDMVSRGNNVVSHGNIAGGFPRTRSMIIDIDRRTYLGSAEPTDPNKTFGFNRLYGPGRYAANPPAAPGSDIYYKAILSSTDNHVLRCDLTHNSGIRRDGICVDDFGHIYDVVSSR